nr:hypothetical protein [Morchella crassipes]
MLSKTADPPPGTPLTSFMWGFFYIKRGEGCPSPPLEAPVGGLHGFSWGPPSTAATQLLRSERGGAAPPLASPPTGGGGRFPLLLLLGRARVARPPKQKWNRPRPSFLFSIKNWKEESWKRAKRGGEMHLSSVGERDADGYGGGGPQENPLISDERGGLGGGVSLTEGGGDRSSLWPIPPPPLSL